MQKKIVLTKSGIEIGEVSAASYSDKLSGEMTLSFQTRSEKILSAKVGDRLTFNEQIFRIVSVNRGIYDGAFLGSVSAEHITFTLADEEYDFDEFIFSGTASGALSKILEGTEFAGTVELEINLAVEFNRKNTISRRTLLNDLCGKINGEIIYDGAKIQIVSHRGRRERYTINKEFSVADFNITENEEGVSYELTTDKAYGLEVGDEVRVSLGKPFEIETNTRIIGISYNPYYRREVIVVMGDYQRDIVDEIIDEREEADDLRESLNDYVNKTELDDKVASSVDTYINSEDGKSSLVHSLTGEFISSDDADGYVKTTELSAEIGAYIDSAAGTAKIVQNLTGSFVKSDELGNYVEKTELSAEIGAYIDTTSGTAKIVSAVSGTYQKKSDMSSYVEKTSLSSEIGQYIDSVSGKAKIVSAVSGTYQTISGMSEYATVKTTASIEQSISDVEASITLSSTYTKNTIGTNVYALLQLVSNANSSSIKIKADKIDFTGFTTFLRASDLGSSGTTTIDGARITTGTISADRIDVDDLAVKTIYGTGTYSSSKLLYSDANNLYMGGTSLASSKVSNIYMYSLNDIEIYAGYHIYLSGNGSRAIEIYTSGFSGYIKPTINGGVDLGQSSYRWGALYVENGKLGNSNYNISFDGYGSLIPSTTSTLSGYFEIGSSSKPFSKLYVKELYINGTKFESGGSSTSFAGKAVTMGGSSSYYIQATTSRQLCPNTSSTYNEFYLGTSSYYWHYAYIGSTAAYIGNSTSSKLGFFGTTPAARQTVSSSATVETLIKALKAYGLIG